MLSKSSSARRVNRNLDTASATADFNRLADTAKDVAACNTAGIACVNRRSQPGEFRLELLLFALQGAESRAHHFAGIFVTPALDLGGNEAVKIAGQIDIAGRHESVLSTG